MEQSLHCLFGWHSPSHFLWVVCFVGRWISGYLFSSLCCFICVTQMSKYIRRPRSVRSLISRGSTISTLPSMEPKIGSTTFAVAKSNSDLAVSVPVFCHVRWWCVLGCEVVWACDLLMLCLILSYLFTIPPKHDAPLFIRVGVDVDVYPWTDPRSVLPIPFQFRTRTGRWLLFA